MTRLCTLSPSWPAKGPSLMRNVIESVGGSTGWAGSGSGRRRVAQRVGDVRLLHAGDGDDVAGLGQLDRGALQSAEGQDLLHAEGLDQVAVAAERLHRLVGPDRARA